MSDQQHPLQQVQGKHKPKTTKDHAAKRKTIPPVRQHLHDEGEKEHRDTVSISLGSIKNGNGATSIELGDRIHEDHPDTVHLTVDTIAPQERIYIKVFRKIFTGVPISTENALQERIGRVKALAILSSDALSSVAYGTEASLAVLIAAGAGALSHNLLLGFVVVLLLAIVTFSYRQTIFHYPNGGGSYIVAKENLNVHYGLIAAAALLIDYILTVSVSISAGVDALVSSFSNLTPWSVEIGLALIGLMILINIRGVRDSGTIFAAPTYIFIGSFMLLLGVGLFRAFTSGGGLLTPLPPSPSQLAGTERLTLFLVLTAFASGCSAMTGTEAISNGVPIFKEPQAQNAAKTLTTMAIVLGIMYGGTTFLAWRFGVTPQLYQQPTLIHNLASQLFNGPVAGFTYFFDLATMAILVLAANTSFADFPRLSSILARDNYLPHFFSTQGDRLAFNVGIIVLGVMAGILLSVFHGNTEALINLYALGVFAAFTLSQAGMVKRWLDRKEPAWQRGLAINLLGAITTGIVTIVIAVSKFERGAWVVVILIPLLYGIFQLIYAHYAAVKVGIENMSVYFPAQRRHLVIVPIASITNLSRRGLSYARTLSPYVLAVNVATTADEEHDIQAAWDDLLHHEHFLDDGPIPTTTELAASMLPVSAEDIVGEINGPKLIVIKSPYRALAGPIIHFLDALLKEGHKQDLITVVLPEFVNRNIWDGILHNQTVLRLKWRLLRRSRIVTANVPYRLPSSNHPNPLDELPQPLLGLGKRDVPHPIPMTTDATKPPLPNEPLSSSRPVSATLERDSESSHS